MTDTSASNPSNNVRCEHTAAFLLLRLFLGLRTLIAGLEKFEANKSFSIANYQENMVRMATGISSYSLIPLWAAKAFALSLPWMLLGAGIGILLGLKTRAALFFGGLIYVGLGFGLMAVQEGEGVAWIGMQVLMFSFALYLARADRFCLWADKH
jgi:thiosulfate dehydrogenase [quinone] large subunit